MNEKEASGKAPRGRGRKREKVRFNFCLFPDNVNSTPPVGPSVLGPHGDLVSSCADRLPVSPALFMLSQSSLNEDVVQEHIHHNIVTGIALSSHFPAAAHSLLVILFSPCLATPTPRLRSLLCDQLSRLAYTKEVFLDFSGNYHGFWRAVESPPCLL